MPAKSQHNPNASRLIDEYIARAPEFARPICTRLRKVIHKAEPRIIEDWKWGPNFFLDGMVCNFGAFKKHVGLAFFQGALMKDPQKLFIQEATPAKSMRRINFTNIKDINESVLASYVREAVKVNKSGDLKASLDRVLKIPNDLKKVLPARSREFFNSLSYTNRKEYVRWIETAKKEITRKMRVQRAAQMLSKRIQHP